MQRVHDALWPRLPTVMRRAFDHLGATVSNATGARVSPATASLAAALMCAWAVNKWLLYPLAFTVYRRYRPWQPDPKSLRGRVAIVTGASRGVGKGIALGLGEAGATVYVTGRTLTEGDSPLPGTIGTTAREVSEAGGEGIAVQCDHANDEDIERLIERVMEEQGKIDILVNNVFMFPDDEKVEQPFWVQGTGFWDQCHRVGLRSHYVASCLAAKHMVERKSGLIVNISSVGGKQYLFNVAYGVGKAAVDRMARDMAHELKPHNVCAVSLWPGMVRTERFIEDAETFATRYKVDVIRGGESARYTGRAVAALAADPKGAMKRTGRAINVSALAWQYGFTDVDGRQPGQLGSLWFLVENAYYYMLYCMYGPLIPARREQRESVWE